MRKMPSAAIEHRRQTASADGYCRRSWGILKWGPSEDKRMASRLIRNQLPFTGLWVRVPCPPLP